MSAIGHYLESEGIPTAGISLVREHSEAMRPPRALWVPFMLGRPLGVPDDPPFQREVLRGLLDLFESRQGPVLLRDFPRDAPADPPGRASDEADETLVCPVSFVRAAPDPGSPAARERALHDEISQLQPWQDLAARRRGGSAVGLSAQDIASVGRRLCAFVAGDAEAIPAGAGAAAWLKLACDDLRAFYEEAASAQPAPLDAPGVRAWFYQRTVAGQVLGEVRDRALASDDAALRALGARVLIPRAVGHA